MADTNASWHEVDRVLDQREREGLSWARAAAESGVPAWRLRYRARTRPSPLPSFVEIVAAPTPWPAPPTPLRSSFDLLLDSGVRVVVPADFDEAALRRLLATIGSPC